MGLADRLRAAAAADLADRPAASPQPAESVGTAQRLSERLSRPGLPAAGDHEMRRILALPVRPPITAEEVEDYSRRHVLAPAFEAGFRLMPAQVDLVREYERTGAFGQIPVGGGKTLASLMVAQKAHERGLRKILLLTEANLFEQLTRRDIPWARQRVNLTVPIIDLSGRSIAQRQALAASDRRGLYLIPYSLLSSQDGAELLEMVSPELVIADEAHNLKNRSAARTGRFLAHMRKHRPQYLPMSGTISGKSISDYHHQISLALGDKSPLPTSVIVAGDWGQVIDSGASPSDSQAGPLLPLVDWARYNFPQEDLAPTVTGFRRAFRLRLTSSPGVVVNDDDIGTSLTYVNLDAQVDADYPGKREQMRLVEQVDELCLTPNGDEIEHAMLKWKWLEELSGGFYNELRWPTADDWARRKRVAIETAQQDISRAQEHHALLQVYHSALRKWIKEDGKPGLDTPMLVGREIARNGDQRVSGRLVQAWRAAKEVAWHGMPEREPHAHRVCDYKVKAAAEWVDNLKSDEGAVVWFHHHEMGLWLVEELQRGPRAADVMWCPAEGDRSGINDAILDPLANKRKILVASLGAHSRGKNLQYLANMLFVQFPRDSTTAEQSVGRLHRKGQEADHLDVVTMRSCWHDELSFAACINDSLYVHQSTGSRRKIIYASHVPMPKVYLPEFLREQGLQPEMLDPKMRREMEDRFGEFQR